MTYSFLELLIFIWLTLLHTMWIQTSSETNHEIKTNIFTCFWYWYLKIQWSLIFANVLCCSRPRIWVGFYFKFTPAFFQWMFFPSVKQIGGLRKEINRLLSKGMSNNYLKVTKKNRRSQKFDFLNLKNLSPVQFLGSSNSGRYHWILKLLAAT